MSRRCELTGKSPMVGNNVSHANDKTKRRFLPNLTEVSLTSETLGQTHRLRISAHALRSIDHRGWPQRLPRQGARRRAFGEGPQAEARDRQGRPRSLTTPQGEAIKAAVPTAAFCIAANQAINSRGKPRLLKVS